MVCSKQGDLTRSEIWKKSSWTKYVSRLQKSPCWCRFQGKLSGPGNTAPEARLDVSAISIGFWGPQAGMFADVRVFEPGCKYYENLGPDQIYAQHERQKKLEYNDRVINVERGTLTSSFSQPREVWVEKQLASTNNWLGSSRGKKDSSAET